MRFSMKRWIIVFVLSSLCWIFCAYICEPYHKQILYQYEDLNSAGIPYSIVNKNKRLLEKHKEDTEAIPQYSGIKYKLRISRYRHRYHSYYRRMYIFMIIKGDKVYTSPQSSSKFQDDIPLSIYRIRQHGDQLILNTIDSDAGKEDLPDCYHSVKCFENILKINLHTKRAIAYSFTPEDVRRIGL